MEENENNKVSSDICHLFKIHKLLNIHQISNYINEKELDVLRTVNELCKDNVLFIGALSSNDELSIYYKMK